MPGAGILDWKRRKYYRPILHNPKSPETSRRIFLEYIKNIGEESTRGGPPASHKGGRRPPPPDLVGPLAGLQCPSSAIWCLLPWKKIRMKLSGRRASV